MCENTEGVHSFYIWGFMALSSPGSGAVDKSFGGDIHRKLQLKQETGVRAKEFHQIHSVNIIDPVISVCVDYFCFILSLNDVKCGKL